MREIIGCWWTDDLYTPVQGMGTLPFQFTKPYPLNGWGPNKEVFLSPRISYGSRVLGIEALNSGVIINGKNASTSCPFESKGDATIVTLPIPILRQTKIAHSGKTNELMDIKRVLGNFTYEPSTRVLLQCKSRFWEADVGPGGFSRTDQPIGQVHYPTYKEIQPSGNTGERDTNRGILLCYTWGQDAIMMGSQTEEEAVASAVQQVESIHKDINTQFEVGRLHAWTKDPAAQLAYAYLTPGQYHASLKTLGNTDIHPIHLAGEALSWSHGWIQGALESGLRAAYNIVCKFEPDASK